MYKNVLPARTLVLQQIITLDIELSYFVFSRHKSTTGFQKAVPNIPAEPVKYILTCQNRPGLEGPGLKCALQTRLDFEF